MSTSKKMNYQTIIAVLLGAAAAGSLKKTVQGACEAGDFAKLKDVKCEQVKPSWLKQCWKNKDCNKDAAFAAVLSGLSSECKDKWYPKKDKQFVKIARKLFKHNQKATLKVFLSDDRCDRLGNDLRDFFISVPDMELGTVCKKGGSSPVLPGGDSSKPPAASTTPPPANALTGSLVGYTEKEVGAQKDLLARITTLQAAELALTNNACLGLTAEHFAAPGVNPDVVASLNCQCFRMIQPDAFSGLTKDQVRKITAWPFVRRKQVAAIKPSVIPYVPFDQLGVGEQTKKNLKKHACYGVTNKQMKAIKKHKHAKKLFGKRCIKNDAAPGTTLGKPYILVAATMLLGLLAF